METFSALLAICAGYSPVPGEFPAQRPVTRSFYVFFDLRLNKRLSKQSWGWAFETLSRPLWRHRNVFRITDPLWGKPPVTGGYSSQRSVIAESWCFFFSLFLAWTSCWINSCVASDLRRGHANVTAMVHIHFDRLYKRIGQCARSCNDKANIMMTSWNENILRVTGPLFGESTGSSVDLHIYCNVSKIMIHSACLRQHAIKYSDAELSCFFFFFALICFWTIGWAHNR